MTSLALPILVAVVLWLLRQWYEFESMKRKLSQTPMIGSSNFILGYVSYLQFALNGHNLVTEGYRKYPAGLFKMRSAAYVNGWVIIGSGTEFIEDILLMATLMTRRRRIDLVSQAFGSEWLNGGRDAGVSQPYHLDVARLSPTRSFPARFDELHDEISASVGDTFGRANAWNSVPLAKVLLSVVARTTNRLFIGLPLCRNEFVKVIERSAIRRIIAANVLHLVPGVLKPLVGKLISPITTALRDLEPLLGPMIRERLHQEAVEGAERPSRPDDLITWLLDIAPPDKRSVEDLIFRVLSLNFVSVITTTITLTNALFDLAAHPEYLAPLRGGRGHSVPI